MTHKVGWRPSQPAVPHLIYGLKSFEIMKPVNPKLCLKLISNSTEAFVLQLEGWDNKIKNFEASYMVLPNDNVLFQSSEMDTQSLGNRAQAAPCK